MMKRSSFFRIGIPILAAAMMVALAAVRQGAAVAQEGTDDDAEASPKTAEPTPEFRSESAAESFKEGLGLYEKKEFEDAERAFKKALSSAKDSASRDIVKNWVVAAEYSPSLEKTAKLVEEKRYSEATKFLTQIQAKIDGTPAMKRWTELATQVETALYQTLEGFDVVSRRYSPKYGKTFVNDRSQVFRGEHCLRWQNTPDNKAGVLKIANVPPDWEKIEALEVWVNTPVALPLETVVLTDKDPKAGGKNAPPARPRAPGQQIVTSYMQELIVKPAPGRWQRVYLPLAQFKPQGDPTFSKVKEVRFQIPGGRKFDFLIDEIRLKKKDETKTKARSRR